MARIIYAPLGKPRIRRNPDPPVYGACEVQPRRYRSAKHQTSTRDNFGGLRVETALVRDTDYQRGPTITCADDVYRLLRRALGNDPDERFLVVLLDGGHNAIGIYEAGHGSMTTVEVHPRNVFRAAIVANAHAVILAHNHPSTDTYPSEEDRALTRRMVKAGELLGTSVLDSLVIGLNDFTSLSERGLM
jgi:DNA repair protein RadC